MRLISLALALAPLAIVACSPAEAPAAAAPSAAAETPATPEVSAAEVDEPALNAAIDTFLGENSATTRTVLRVVGEGQSRIALVYLVDPNWCGSGGCNLLILRQGADGWDNIGSVSRVSNPVRVLSTSTNGLPDIGVTVSGGGGPPPYEAKLSFSGETYPRSPSDEPLVGAEGTVVMTDADIPPPE